MKYLMVFFMMLFSATSYSFPKEICFESYPEVSWLVTEKKYWELEEAYNHQYAYYWYHLLKSFEKKDSEGYVVVQLIGHGRDRNGDEVSLTGRGFKVKDHWHFEFTSMLVQSVGIGNVDKDKPAQGSNYPSYEVNIVWDMFGTYKFGNGYIINDIANSQSFSIEHPDHYHNDFSYIKVNSIPCRKHP